jgi:hypothetical protein
VPPLPSSRFDQGDRFDLDSRFDQGGRVSGRIQPTSPAPRFTSDPADRRHTRVGAIALVVVAVLALLGAGIAIMVTLRARQSPTSAGAPGASASALPTPEATSPASTVPPVENKGAPTELRLNDSRSAVTLTWKDPASGQVQFIIAGGQGTDLRALRTTRETTFTLNGLNPRLDYCFTVAAVYGTDRVAVSNLVCTSRNSPSAPSGSHKSTT